MHEWTPDWGAVLGRGLAFNPQWFHRHESLFSIARKLARGNGVRHEVVMELLLPPRSKAGTTSWLFPPAELTAYLSKLLARPEGDIRTCFLLDLVQGADDSSIAKGLRYCSRCLAQSYHSCLFQLLLLERCPLHQELLMVRCPHCRCLPAFVGAAQTSFTRCAACRRPYFLEPADWLQEFKVPVDTSPLDDVVARLRLRGRDDYLEARVKQWDGQIGTCRIGSSPAISALGAAVTGQAGSFTPLMQGWVRLTTNEELFCPGSPTLVRLGEAAVETFQRLAKDYGARLGDIHYLPKPTVVDQALWLAMRQSGFAWGVASDYWARRLLNIDLFGGAITEAGGKAVIADPKAVWVITAAIVEALFFEALDWLRAVPEGSDWRDVFTGRAQLKFPVVWLGARAGDDRTRAWVTVVSSLTPDSKSKALAALAV